MPSIVGNIKIISVGSSSIVQIGDALLLNPTSSNKTYAGANSFNTGDLLTSNAAVSNTNTSDNDLVDDISRTGLL